MNDTYTIFQKLNNNDILSIVGDRPTVKFNNNVTVFIYPKIVYIPHEDYNNITTIDNDTTDNQSDTDDTCFRKNRIYTKILLFFKSVKKIGI